MSTEPDLLYTDVEDALRAAVRGLLADRCAPAGVLACFDGDRGLVADLWPRLSAELGLSALLVPEAYGGAGGRAREAAVVLEELGRAVAPVPYLTSAVVGTTALLASPAPAAGDLLSELAAGRRTVALVLPLDAGPGAARFDVRAEDDGLRGRVANVAGAAEADVLLVPVRTAEGVELRAVPAMAARVEPVSSLDMSRQLADVSLSGVSGDLVAPAGAGRSAIGDALLTGAALLASEQLGLAQRCLDTTVEYVRTRRQFGRAIGGFQAVKHRLADLYVEVESMRAAARHAATATHDAERPVAALVARAFCGTAAVRVAEEAVQLHGGIGMTWEHPLHLYLKRAKADQVTFGTPGSLHAELARLIALPAPA
ncbi:acyl-CoA dehydrogenase family protein [Spongiactinospora sp. TRM90649]|uniref:acyl-CoA dehydrogenase family protein n=1 Tax=Spongiactinospora sp. TRM90649 TaxID=3031114 RepID=UPI0023F639ED|nr:acyl-CoA dehydrogenase family protein [Spongiactinospora sp. TRM90649]MDF5752150.1 acyl-CoA/acyl-ACP dehydrogenase [Spongiactinospora sp. TRM90649]